MDISTRDYKRVSVIRVTGRVDASTYTQLDAKLQEYIDSGRRHLVVEMDATEFLSSAGARVLIEAQKALRAKGGRLVIAQPSTQVREVIALAGLDAVLPIYDDTMTAVGTE